MGERDRGVPHGGDEETVWLTALKSTLLGETNDKKTFCKTAHVEKR